VAFGVSGNIMSLMQVANSATVLGELAVMTLLLDMTA
jgi:hypothetical protein